MKEHILAYSFAVRHPFVFAQEAQRSGMRTAVFAVAGIAAGILGVSVAGSFRPGFFSALGLMIATVLFCALTSISRAGLFNLLPVLGVKYQRGKSARTLLPAFISTLVLFVYVLPAGMLARSLQSPWLCAAAVLNVLLVQSLISAAVLRNQFEINSRSKHILLYLLPAIFDTLSAAAAFIFIVSFFASVLPGA